MVILTHTYHIGFFNRVYFNDSYSFIMGSYQGGFVNGVYACGLPLA